MITDTFIALLFIVGAIVQFSFIQALAYPISLFPLHFLIGVVVIHRAGSTSGVIWFAASGLLLSFFGFDSAHLTSYLVVAVLGAVLSARVFTTRSVYALEGLGISLFAIFLIINAMLDLNFTPNPPELAFKFISLSLGLYLTFLTARYLEHLASNIFLVKRKN